MFSLGAAEKIGGENAEFFELPSWGVHGLLRRRSPSDDGGSIGFHQWTNMPNSTTAPHSRKLEGYNFGSFAVFFLFLLTIFIVLSWLLRCCQYVAVEGNNRSQQQQQRQQVQQQTTSRGPILPSTILIRGENSRDSTEQVELNEAIKKSREEYIKSFLLTKDASGDLLSRDQKPAEALEGGLKNSSADIEENGADNCCSICLDEYAPGDRISRAKNVSSCQHLFHEHCITGWLMNNDNCPICRASYFDVNHIFNEDAKESE
jgi:hypothetical protein